MNPTQKLIAGVTAATISIFGIAGGAWAVTHDDTPTVDPPIAEGERDSTGADATPATVPAPSTDRSAPAPRSDTSESSQPPSSPGSTTTAPAPAPLPESTDPAPTPRSSSPLPDGTSIAEVIRISGSNGVISVQIGDSLYEVAADATIAGSDGGTVDVATWAAAHTDVSPDNPLLVEVTISGGAITALQNQ